MTVHEELEPGPYSVILLYDDGTWKQPTYEVPTGLNEHSLCALVLEKHPDAFLAVSVCPDPDCSEAYTREL